MTGQHSRGRVTVRDRVAAYRAASEALRANAEQEQAAGIDWETQEFHHLNDALWDAAEALPRWLRWWLR